MNKLALVITFTLSCIISFLLGNAFNTYSLSKESAVNFNEMARMALDTEMETSRLIYFYEMSVEQPEEVSKYLKKSIIFNYQDDLRVRGIFKEDFGANLPAFKTNLLISDFLLEHPEEACKNLERREMVECHFEWLEE